MNSDVLGQQRTTQQEDFYHAVIDNNVELVNTLFHLIDVNNLNENGEPVLYHTITNQQWKIAQLLIEGKAQLSNDNWSKTCKKVVPNILHYATQDHNVDESFIDFLLSKTNIERSNQSFYTPILTAARYGNLRILKHLVGNHDPDVHAKSIYGHNLFHCAILSQDKCTIELLDTISLLGVDINHFDNGKNLLQQQATPLTLAIYNRLSFEIIKHLVELGADIITSNDLQYNPHGDKSTDSQVQSHLFKAIQSKDDDYKIFNYLVEQCPNSSLIPFKCILQQEFIRGNIDSIQFIIEKYRIKFDEDQHQIDLFESVFNSFSSNTKLFQSPQFSLQVKIIEYLLTQNVQNCFNFDSNNRFFTTKSTPLLIFAEYPQTSLKLLQLMVQNGAYVNDVDEDGHLFSYGDGVLQHLCSIQQDTPAEDIIQKIDYFISMGVDVNYNIHPTTKKKVATALHVAVLNRRFSSVLIPHLVQHHNADITLTDDDNAVPLHDVLEPELIPLLSSPSTINHQTLRGCTPLLLLPQNVQSFRWNIDKYIQLISKLIECGANVNIPDNHGDYPIHSIFRYYFHLQPINVIELIIKQHAINNIDLNIIGSLGLTPLQLAIQQCIQTFDTINKNISLTSPESRLKSIQSIKLLLQYNANVTTITSKGRTLLHFIAMNADCVRRGFEIDDDLVEDCMVAIINGIIDQTIINVKNNDNKQD